MTKLKHYRLLRKFGEDLLQEISVDNDPSKFIYAGIIEGYTRAIIDACGLDKSEAANIRKEAEEIRYASTAKCMQVDYCKRYQRALDYCMERLGKSEQFKKVLRKASTDEILRLYEISWYEGNSCDFYDAFEELENKYLIGRNADHD